MVYKRQREWGLWGAASRHRSRRRQPQSFLDLQTPVPPCWFIADWRPIRTFKMRLRGFFWRV